MGLLCILGCSAPAPIPPQVHNSNVVIAPIPLQPVTSVPEVFVEDDIAVTYRVVSTDGHPVSGTVTFTTTAARGSSPL